MDEIKNILIPSLGAEPYTQQTILLGRVIPKKNSRINTRSGRSFPSREYVAWHADALRQLEAAKMKPVINPAGMSFNFTFGDRRKNDLDNRITSILDLLVDAGILKDDGYRQVPYMLAFSKYEKDVWETEVSMLWFEEKKGDQE